MSDSLRLRVLLRCICFPVLLFPVRRIHMYIHPAHRFLSLNIRRIPYIYFRCCHIHICIPGYSCCRSALSAQVRHKHMQTRLRLNSLFFQISVSRFVCICNKSNSSVFYLTQISETVIFKRVRMRAVRPLYAAYICLRIFIYH